MRRRLAAIGVSALILYFRAQGQFGPDAVLYAFPFLLVFAFGVLLFRDWLVLGGLEFFLLFLCTWSFIDERDWGYFILPLAAPILLWASGFYLQTWNRRIEKAEERRNLAVQEMTELKERFEARMDSLVHLENRVSGLLKLFEIAKEFNECLSFAELVTVLDQKISPQLELSKGLLTLVSASSSEEGKAAQSFSFGLHKRTDTDEIDRFAKACLKGLKEARSLVKINMINQDEYDLYHPFNVDKPLWLFPFLIERELISVFAVEGAREEDLPNFEILASQLPLQVKKIKLYETVKEISIIDGLTQVFVRRHFLERFQEEFKRAVRHKFPLSVLMVDVDNFKSYNDRLGHLVGDRTLREVAQVIRENVRRVDVVGRYGGEEFIVVAPETDRRRAVDLAERIRSSVARRRFQIYDEETRVTISVGTSTFPDHLSEAQEKPYSEDDLRELIEKADQALYRAKEEGRNRVVEYASNT